MAYHESNILYRRTCCPVRKNKKVYFYIFSKFFLYAITDFLIGFLYKMLLSFNVIFKIRLWADNLKEALWDLKIYQIKNLREKFSQIGFYEMLKLTNTLSYPGFLYCHFALISVDGTWYKCRQSEMWTEIIALDDTIL